MVYFVAIWYIYIPIFACCAKKNLATLLCHSVSTSELYGAYYACSSQRSLSIEIGRHVGIWTRILSFLRRIRWLLRHAELHTKFSLSSKKVLSLFTA
jgi:hypothetical protein